MLVACERAQIDIAKIRVSNHSQVELKKVKMEIVKPWITQRVTELMGMEDELVINFVFAQLELDVQCTL